MKRRVGVAMAVGAVALTVVAVTPELPAPAAGRCSGIANNARRQRCLDSLMPASYSMHMMGMPDYGGGSKTYRGTKRSVANLRGPSGTPDVTRRLTAAFQRVTVAGRRQRAYTVNGKSPGPTIFATQGDLVRVVLHNRNINAGTTIHWHGINVPNGEDGVAGVTQNAVLRGKSYVYRFRARNAGTYWYHSHQYSQQQVTQGLIGAVVIRPRGVTPPPPNASDVVALVHSYRGRNTIDGRTGRTVVPGTVGSRRIRFVNTNQTGMFVASTAPYQVAAIDGVEVNGPTTVSPNTAVEVPAAGRVDIVLDSTVTSARVGVLGGPSMVLGGVAVPRLSTNRVFDPLRYGVPDPSVKIPRPDRRFEYVIGQRRGYLDGKYGTWFTIDRQIIPHVPMFMVKPGETVRVHFQNNTFIDHPMHLHGSHMLVLSRNGHKSTGSPWSVDTLQVHPGDSFVVQVVTKNPGDWMFHCHILAHAAAGLMTHMAYLNVRNPFLIGRVSRRLTNHPE